MSDDTAKKTLEKILKDRKEKIEWTWEDHKKSILRLKEKSLQLLVIMALIKKHNLNRY